MRGSRRNVLQPTKANEETYTRKTKRDITERGVFLIGKHEQGPRLAYDEISRPSVVMASLKDCTVRMDLQKGAALHAATIKLGLLESDIYFSVSLVNMYAKCGCLLIAQDVFDKLLNRNSVAWNAMIAGYRENGYDEKALTCAKTMQNEGICLNGVTFLCLLKACGNLRSVDKGREIHAAIVGGGLLLNDVSIGSALINMYVQCGILKQAQELLDCLPSRNVISWTAMIAGYAQHEHGKHAIACFEQMKYEGLSPNPVTYLCILKACGSIGEIDKGATIHLEITKRCLMNKNFFIGNALMDMYLKCSNVNKALEVFDILLIRDTVSWNVLIAGYAQNDHYEEALSSFQQIRQECHLPDSVTTVNVLKACGNIGDTEMGMGLHTEIYGQELLQKNMLVGNALIGMYAKCSSLLAATKVFYKLPERNTISWNTIIAGYTQHGHDEIALELFTQMQHEGFSPNAITYIFILKAHGKMGVLGKCEQMHEKVMREGMMQHTSVGNALVDMYAKCGDIIKAQEVFDELPAYDTVSWTFLIAGYAEHGYAEESLEHFDKMQQEGICPNVVTLIYILKACGDLGVAERGHVIHNEIVRSGFLEKDIFLGTALVDMYAKCGLPEKAQKIFNKIKAHNTVSWSSLISGYALCGMHDHVFSTFSRMLQDRVEPSAATFAILLNACSHSGLLDIGLICFTIIDRVFGIIPSLEHHTCMVDLFSRAGQFVKAIVVITEMPFLADPTVWHSFLGACKKWENADLGVSSFVHAIQLDAKDSGAYICMSNLMQLQSSNLYDAELVSTTIDEWGSNTHSITMKID